ncbi:MAG: hypothetical protein J7L80_01635 [Thermoplasmata archaeon]|nr:hypothetical protein [Thermoplasmata archaeon]
MVKLRKEKVVKVDKKEGINEINNWLQRIQQRVESIEKRLDAVERRLSGESFESVKFVGEVKGDSGLIKKLEEEINELREELKKIDKSGRDKKEKEVVISLKKKGVEDNVLKEIANMERRLERLEKKKATPVVKVGKIEVPVEITGIVGGLLALFIAALLFGGYKKLVISPSFVMFIGIVLLTATALKTYLINVGRR